MSTVGINFGSISSGAGFDVASTVSSIMAIERMPETAWSNQTSALQKQDAALSTLGTDMAALSAAVTNLTDVNGAFSQKEGAVTDNTVLALTSADNTAQAGTHTLTVQQIATACDQNSNAVGAADTLSGTFSITVGSGAAQTITLDTTNNTLAGLASAINSLNIGVAASVITDSTGARLSLVSVGTGASSEISTGGSTVSDTTTGTALAMTETQAATDAKYTLDGIALTSGSNTITSALQGVTFQLLAPTTSTVQMVIANNTTGIASAMQSFVSAYNALGKDLSAQESNDSAGTAQPLYGDPIISQIQQQLSSSLSFVTSNTGTSSNLAQIGLGVQPDGTLSLDTNALASALQSNFAGVQNFFENVGDFGQNLATTLNTLGTTADGALALREAENTSQEKTLADNTSNLETELAGYQANLTNELNTANAVLQQIPNQLNEVDQIYAAITGYNTKTG